VRTGSSRVQWKAFVNKVMGSAKAGNLVNNHQMLKTVEVTFSKGTKSALRQFCPCRPERVETRCFSLLRQQFAPLALRIIANPILTVISFTCSAMDHWPSLKLREFPSPVSVKSVKLCGRLAWRSLLYDHEFQFSLIPGRVRQGHRTKNRACWSANGGGRSN